MTWSYLICKDSPDYLYQANESYFVRKFYLFSHLRNIIVPEI